LLVDRIGRIEQAIDRAAERDDDAWAEYRAKCEAEDKAKAALLADTAEMVERSRVETMQHVEHSRVEAAGNVERVRVLLAEEVERLRVETAQKLDAHRLEQFAAVDKRLKAVWGELRRRPGASRPPFWRNISGRFLIISGLIALLLLSAMFNAGNLGKLCWELLARMAGK
jgi:hypothetical protein